MLLLNEIDDLTNKIIKWKNLTQVYPDTELVLDKLYSPTIAQTATEIEIIVFPGGYHYINIYKDISINEINYKIYGFSETIRICEIYMNCLSGTQYTEKLKELKTLPIINRKIDLYILDIIKNDKYKVNKSTLPSSVLTLLHFL